MKPKHSIVIVDDDDDDREIIRDAFEKTVSGQEYIFMDNGEMLLEYLEKNRSNGPSLIMLDLNMPGKDGREILKEIKTSNRFHQIPTVVFTTSSSPKDKQAVYELGANCFITKPDTFNKLIELTSSISKPWLE